MKKLSRFALLGVLILGACSEDPTALPPESRPSDGGAFLVDVGLPPMDANLPNPDSGVAINSDAEAASDAGTVISDSGMPNDANLARDAGVPVGSDAQAQTDVGFLADSGIPPIALQISPDFISIPLGTSQNLNLSIQAGVPAIWSVDGVAGGDANLGFIRNPAGDVTTATYTAPQDTSLIPVTRVITAQTFGGQGTALITLIAPSLNVSRVTPDTVDTGATATPIVINGDGFVSSTLVELDGVNVPIQNYNWNQIEATIPSSLLTTAGERRLVVRSPAPGGGTESTAFTVVLRETIIGANLPNNIDALFAAATAGNNPALRPSFTYPENNSYAPKDFPAPRFSWSQATNHNVCRVSLRSPAVAIDAYVSTTGLPANENPNLVIQSAKWSDIVATSIQEIMLQHTVSCSELSGNTISGNAVYESPQQTYHVVPQDAGGRIVYFSGLVEGLWKIDIDANRATAVPWIGPEPTFTLESSSCIGCHSFSSSGQKMSYAIRAPDWSVELAAITANTPSIDLPGNQGGEAVWTAMHPDGRYVLVTDLAAQLVLLDGNTGQVITQVPFSAAGMNATQAFWSPLGDEFAFVTGTEGTNGVTDFAGGEVWTMSFSIVNGQPQFGAPVRIAGPDVIGGTAYYPAYTPDGEYLVFCRAPTGSSYNNPNATLWMTKADGSGTPVALGNANQVANLSNSWPRWAPSMSNGRYWLLFSSQRPYPPFNGTGPQQLWVTLVDPAALPSDPSKAAIWLNGQEPFTGNLTAEWTVAR